MHQFIKATIWIYELPLNQTLDINGKKLISRKGILLQLVDHQNKVGVGEIAPLPGLHKETIAQSLESTEKICRQLQDPHFVLSNLEGLLPSVQFGLDMATWMLQDPPLSTQIKKLPIQTLITPTDKGWKQKVMQRKHEGWFAFKCKVGRQRKEIEQKNIEEIRELIGKNSILRLDANRRWELQEAISFCQSIEHCQVDLLEEPLKQLSQIPEFIGQTEIPIGLDESLHLNPKLSKQLVQQNLISALVLKPSVLGGRLKTEGWIKLAEQNKRKVIFSSAFESALGRWFLIQWAKELKQSPTPIGMDTSSWFQKDFFQRQPFDPYTSNEQLDLTSLFQSDLLKHHKTYLLTP